MGFRLGGGGPSGYQRAPIGGGVPQSPIGVGTGFAPYAGQPVAGAPQQSGTKWYDWIGPALVGGGALYGAYTQNQNAKTNQKNQQAFLNQIGAKADALTWGDEIPTIQSLVGLANQNVGSMVGQDGLMQLMRANPANASLQSTIAAGGNPFDTSELFRSLGAVDAANTTQQVSQLRGGFNSLGSRFGSAAAGAEARLRQGIARDTSARNAGIAQGAHESAQGRMLQASGLLSQNTTDAFGQILGLNNQRMQALGSIFQQLLAQRQYNANLLGIQAGLAPAPITAPGYGGALMDAGQILTILPYLR